MNKRLYEPTISKRCPGCGWLFSCTEETTRLRCLACDSKMRLHPTEGESA